MKGLVLRVSLEAGAAKGAGKMFDVCDAAVGAEVAGTWL